MHRRFSLGLLLALTLVPCGQVLTSGSLRADDPLKEAVCYCEWVVTCSQGQGASGRTSASTIALAEEVALTLAMDWANANCGTESSFSIDRESYCEEEGSSESVASAPREFNGWKVKYQCMSCTGIPISITRRANCFREAYCSAKLAVLNDLKRPEFGGARPGSCCYKIVQRPVCCKCR